MKRYVWKRQSPPYYSGHPTLTRWVDLEELNVSNTFASQADAYEAYGRYALRIVQEDGSNGFGPVDRLRWMDLKLVVVVPPSSRWMEASV